MLHNLQKGFSLIGLLISVVLVTGGIIGYFVYQETVPSLVHPDGLSKETASNIEEPKNDLLPPQKSVVEQRPVSNGTVVIQKFPSYEFSKALQDYYEERVKADSALKSEAGYLEVFNEFYILHQNDPGIQEHEKLGKLEGTYSERWQALKYPTGVGIGSLFVYRYDEKGLFDYSPYLSTQRKESIKTTLSCGNLNDVLWIDFDQPHLCEVSRVNGKIAAYAIGILKQDKNEREAGLPAKTVLVNDILILEDDHFVTLRFTGIIPHHPSLGYAWPKETIGTVDFYLDFRPNEDYWDVVNTQVSGYLQQPSEEIKGMMQTLKESVARIF